MTTSAYTSSASYRAIGSGTDSCSGRRPTKTAIGEQAALHLHPGEPEQLGQRKPRPRADQSGPRRRTASPPPARSPPDPGLSPSTHRVSIDIYRMSIDDPGTLSRGTQDHTPANLSRSAIVNCPPAGAIGGAGFQTAFKVRYELRSRCRDRPGPRPRCSRTRERPKRSSRC